MCDCEKKIKADERYVTFKNIDCFGNACAVIDNLLRVLKTPENGNAYWEKFITKIPDAYYSRDSASDTTQALLYLVCSNSSNIMELFENVEDEEAINALEKCEHECC